jgi:hypothetical protein
MKFILHIFISILFIAQAIQAQTIREIGHLEFSDTIFNFGSVKESQGVLSHAFSFVNLGPEYFVIEDIDPSCGCITPDYPSDTVHAGEKGVVTLYVDLVNHPGLFNQTVIVKGNASKDPIHLTVKGYVTPSPQPLPAWERTSSFKYNTIYLQKNYVNYGGISTKNPVSVEIPMYNSGANSVSVQVEKLKLPVYVKVVLMPSKLESKQHGMLKVSFLSKEAPNLGYFAEEIEVLFVSGNIVTKVPIVLTATIKDEFTAAEMASVVGPKILVEKPALELGTIATNQKNVSDIQITNTGKADLIIRSVRTSCSCVEAFVEKTVLKPGATTVLKVVFDTSDRMGPEEKIVSIFSNDASTSIVTIKLKATVVEVAPVVVPVGGQ